MFASSDMPLAIEQAARTGDPGIQQLRDEVRQLRRLHSLAQLACKHPVNTGGRSAINLALSGDISGSEAPAAIRRCAPPYCVSKDTKTPRLSEHTGGLGAPQAVGLEAPPRVVIHSGGCTHWNARRMGNLERCLDPHPPTCTRSLV